MQAINWDSREKFLTCSKVTQTPLFIMGLLALAVAPGIAICIFIYLKDKYNKEPIGLLIWGFILGMLSIIPAIIIQLGFTKYFGDWMNGDLIYIGFYAFVIVALSEEGSKFLVLRLFIYPRKAFDDPFDGIMYTVMVGMGFATLENIGYVYEHGVGTAITRMFLSVPAHGTFAVLMGYYVGLAKFNPSKRGRYFLLAILLPAFFHGGFDFCLFSGIQWLQVTGALSSFAVAIILSLRAIRNKQAISKAHFESTNIIPRDEDQLL